MDRRNLTESFYGIYGVGDEAARVFFAPGRVNILGDHTDYNNGHVLLGALPMGTYAAVRRNDKGVFRFATKRFGNEEEYVTVDPAAFEAKGEWFDRPGEVIREIIDRRYAPEGAGMDVLFDGDLPMSSGLSSATSLCVVTAEAFRKLYDLQFSKRELAYMVQKSKSRLTGVPCGIASSVSSAMAEEERPLFLSIASSRFESLPPMPEDLILLLTNSRVNRREAAGIYQIRREECHRALRKMQVLANVDALGELSADAFQSCKDVIGDEILLRRTRHVVYENTRAIRTASAWRVGNMTKVGEMMNESHFSLRDDYEVSTPELDFLSETARQMEGVLGSRMTGGGFGGCTVTLLKKDAVTDVKERTAAAYEKEFGIVPEFYETRLAAGACEIV